MIQTVGVAFLLLVLVAKFGWLPVGGVVLVGWLAHSWRRPNTACLLCKGRKRNFGSGKSWSFCLLCKGSGRRRRVGAVLLGRGFGGV